MASRKPSVGFYGITGCAGCQLSVLFNDEEILDVLKLVNVTAFPFIREKNIDKDFDVVFVEGLVASANDLETLLKLRERATVLVALGACSHTGCVPAYRKFTLKSDYKHLLYDKKPGISDLEPTPIDAHVKVDYVLPGCPPSKAQILAFISDIAAGRKPRLYDAPVCVECRRNGNACLLEKGKACLGPATTGGCNSVCINGGFECWGCRGQTSDANAAALVKLLESKGHSKEFIRQRMRSFVGLKMTPQAEEALK